MNILYIHSDKASAFPNTWQWRCNNLLDAINQSGKGYADVYPIEDFFQEEQPDVSPYDLIIFQRSMVETSLQMAMSLRAAGKRVVVDLDDAYDLIPKGYSTYDFWLSHDVPYLPEGGTEYTTIKVEYTRFEQLIWGSKIIAGVTVPAKTLQQDWKKYTDRVYIVPNYLSSKLYQTNLHSTVLEAVRDNALSIGWGGSVQHRTGVLQSEVFRGVGKVLRRRNDTQLSLVGAAFTEKDFEKSFIPKDQLRFYGLVSWEEYPRLVSTFDVGLIPLSGPYDQRRSNIKALEYMILKIPWVGSKSPVLDDVEQFGVIVKNTAEDWSRAIQQQLDHPDQKKIELGYEYALSMMADNHVDDVLKTYEEIHRNVYI